MIIPARVRDITGTRSGMLVAILYAGNNSDRKAVWLCVCDCGVFKFVPGYKIWLKEYLSCGCSRKQHISKACTKHGLKKHILYRVWSGMKGRCKYPQTNSYH